MLLMTTVLIALRSGRAPVNRRLTGVGSGVAAIYGSSIQAAGHRPGTVLSTVKEVPSRLVPWVAVKRRPWQT
jgi:hypothetical protein